MSCALLLTLLPPLAVSVRPVRAASCAETLANAIGGTGAAKQLITVVPAATRATSASLTLWRRGADGCWTTAAGPWTARIGRNGLRTHKLEGDGATPAGIFPIGATVYGIAPDPGVRYRYRRLACGDWWDEDPGSSTYNSFRHVRCDTRPRFGGASEALWLQTTAYRYFAVIRYNDDPAVPGRGSAIFLHADIGRPTNGCVSLPLRALVRTLSWLQPMSRPLIAIGTRAELTG